MKDLWQKIINNGITNKFAVERAKRIRITNILLTILIAIVPPYLCILYYIDLHQFMPFLIAACISHFFAYNLISKGRTKIARYICLGSMIITQSYFFFLVGPGMGVEFFFFAIIGVSYLISLPRERIACFIILLLSIVLFGIGAFQTDYVLPFEIEANIKAFITLVNYSISLSVVFLFLFFYNNQIENQIETLDQKVIEKTIEIQETANRVVLLKDEFLSNMSHEIRTPMNAIAGMTELLSKNTNLKGIERDQFEVIRKSSQDLLITLNNILDLSMLKDGQIKATKHVTNLKEIALEITEQYQDEQKKIKSEIVYDPKLPALVDSNKNQITQILSQFIDNAYKFTTTGKVLITFSEVERKHDFVIIKCMVSDTGIGIKKEEQQRLFKTFEQLDQSSTKKEKGIGLGLIICKKLVELFEGEIGVESIVDKGSSFWFSFPATAIKGNQEINHIDNSSHATIMCNSNKKVLIVDDTEWNQMVAQMMLEELGYHTQVASNGIEAIELFKNEKFDAVLMDIQMPEMDGIETTSIIKLIDKSIPVIGLSAYARIEDAEKYISQGLDDYMHKPVSLETLNKKLDLWLK
ncbi:MAG: response regulator [Flavobacteriales bacterium]|nr:response regulator [Flavobacteriales bacterium]